MKLVKPYNYTKKMCMEKVKTIFLKKQIHIIYQKRKKN